MHYMETPRYEYSRSVIQAALFDMDGLMFDTESAYSTVHSVMSQRRGKVFTNEVKMTLMGKRADEVMGLLNRFWGGGEDVEILLQEQDKELIEVYKNSVEKMDGLDDIIDFLDLHNIRKCIGTPSRRFLVDILLEKFDLHNSFEFIVTGEMVEKGKPDPEIYSQCVLKMNLLANQCLVLEDSLNGVKSGVSAGCHTCAVPSKYTEHEDFSTATLVCDSLCDVAIQNFLLSESDISLETTL